MEVTYRRNLYKSYMCIKAQEEVQEEYELCMLERQSIPGILPMQAAMAEGVQTYLYEISGKQQIEDYLAGRKMDYGILQRLLFSIQELCRVLPDYLLREEGLCLEFPFIYVNLEDESLYFTYLPFGRRSLQEAFEEFMEQVLRNIDHQDKAAIDLGYQMYQMCNRENANIGKMLETALGKKEAWMSTQEKGEADSDERAGRSIGRGIGKEEKGKQFPRSLKAACESKENRNIRHNREMEQNKWKAKLICKMDILPCFLREAWPFSLFPKSGESRQETEREKCRDMRVKEYQIPAGEHTPTESTRKRQGQYVSWESKEPFQGEEREERTFSHVERVRRIPERCLPPEPEKEPQARRVRGIPEGYHSPEPEKEPQAKRIRGIPGEYFQEEEQVERGREVVSSTEWARGIPKEYFQEEEPAFGRESGRPVGRDALLNEEIYEGTAQKDGAINKEERTFGVDFQKDGEKAARSRRQKKHWLKRRGKPKIDTLDFSDLCEGNPNASKEPPRYSTEILADFGQRPEGVLVYQGNHGCQDIFVDREEFLVGKNREQVNGVIDAKGVSRLHARIVQEGNVYYIEDLNSTNGTYLNGTPLEYHQRMELCRDDHIRFGGEEYVFC